MEIGSIEIGGKINTSSIESGLKRVETGFKDVDKSSNSVNSDFERISAKTKTLSRTLGIMAITGGSALIALAKGAPATAGAMAKIEVGMMKLQFAVGGALKDDFIWFADKLNSLSSWVNDNPAMFEGIIKGVAGLAAGLAVFKIGGAVVSGFTALSGIITSPIFLGALAAIAVAATAWSKISELSNQSKAYNAIQPAGTKEIQYDAQTSGMTRQFYSDPSQNIPIDLSMYSDFSNYKNSQTNINQATFAWDDIR